MEAIRNKRILALIGIISLVLGTLLPYYTFSFWGYTESISLWGYWEGKVVLSLIVANALFIFKDWLEQYVPQVFNSGIGRKIANVDNPKLSLIPTILIIAFVIYLYNTLEVDSEFIKNGIGFYLLWIGVIALVGHAIFYKGNIEKNNNVSGQNITQNQVNISNEIIQNNPQVELQQSPYEKLTQLKNSLDAGLITQEEFDKEKAKVLGL